MAYYQTYRGPSIVSATLDGEDVTDRVRELYTGENNWGAHIYSFQEAFPCDHDLEGKEIHMVFEGNSTWSKVKCDGPPGQTRMNPPLIMPQNRFQ
jgi:hypothetical protein